MSLNSKLIWITGKGLVSSQWDVSMHLLSIIFILSLPVPAFFLRIGKPSKGTQKLKTFMSPFNREMLNKRMILQALQVLNIPILKATVLLTGQINGLLWLKHCSENIFMVKSNKQTIPLCHVITQAAFSLQNPCAPVVTSPCWIPSSSCMGRGWEACSSSQPSWGKSSGLQPFYRPWVGTVRRSTISFTENSKDRWWEEDMCLIFTVDYVHKV